ncbi:hypothetical protein D3C87_1602580 [compost metagenome]
MHQHGEGVDRLGIDQDRQLDQVADAVIGQRIVKARIALGDGLQAIVEIEHHFIERQIVFHHGAVADIGEVALDAAAILAELEDRAEIFVRGENGRLDPGLADFLDLHHIGQIGRIVQQHGLAIGQQHFVDH